jgi:hypothetical protein
MRIYEFRYQLYATVAREFGAPALHGPNPCSAQMAVDELKVYE